MMTGLMIGAALALGVGLFATLTGMDRDRAFYPTVLIVVASYYDLFAVMGGSDSALMIETLAFTGFACLAVIGFRVNAWLVAVGLAAHGLFDFLRGDLIVNPGVPVWWPAFCGSFDVVAGGYLAWRLARARAPTPATPE